MTILELLDQIRSLIQANALSDPGDTPCGVGVYAVYAVLGAIRGPDQGMRTDHRPGDPVATELKRIIVERVRTIVLSETRIAGNFTTLPLHQDEMRLVAEIAEEIGFDGRRTGDPPTVDYAARYHFLCHLRDAVGVTQDHPIWNGYGYNLLVKLQQIRERTAAAASL